MSIIPAGGEMSTIQKVTLTSQSFLIPFSFFFFLFVPLFSFVLLSRI